MSLSKTILTSKNLTVGYKNKEVLKELDLNLRKGELTCLLGPNGSGKSTLIRSLAGIQKPLAGEVQIHDKSITESNAKEMAKTLSLVLTDRIAPGNLTVYALVSLGRFPYTSWMGALNDSDKALIQWAMEVTGSLQFADRHIGELSDGERQKVMIARALVQDTEIIVLDEPTAHLDSPNRIEIFHLLQDLTKKTGKTILISTHEIDMAIESCDNMWLVMPDKKVALGLPEELILSGSLEKAFGSEALTFDYLKGKFSKNLEGHDFIIEVIGEPVLVKWTKNAINRIQQHIKSDCQVEVLGTPKDPTWKVSGTDKKFNSLTLLISYLKTT